MAVTINASTVNGLIQTADTSGTLNLQANGTTILSASPTGVAVTGTITATGGFPGAGGQLQTQVFTAPGTWTKPASCTQVKVTVVGGGGGGFFPAPGALVGGGSGGAAQAIVPVSAPVAITVGTQGTGTPGAGTSGNTSSFGSAVSSTGGSGQSSAPADGASGTGTVSTGTNIRTGVTGPLISATPLNGGGLPAQPASVVAAGSAYSISGAYRAGAPGPALQAPATTANGGVGGAVIVEFVG